MSDVEQVAIVNDFSEFGLVWKKSKDDTFVVTPLLSNFLFGTIASFSYLYKI